MAVKDPKAWVKNVESLYRAYDAEGVSALYTADATTRFGSRVMTPGDGRNPLAGSSALMRTSMECPRRSTDSWVKESGSPAATRSCSATRSSDVVISVTQCSTWRRVFISRNQKSPSW